MRILHVIHQFFPEHVGGTEQYTRALSAAQQAAGHEVTVFARRFGEAEHLERETWDGLSLYRATSGPFSPTGRFLDTLGDRFLARGLRAALDETRPDVIHVQHAMGLPVAALASAPTRAPVVITLHDYWWVCANAQLITDYDHTICDGPRAWLNCARCGMSRLGLGGTPLFAPLAAPAFALRAAVLGRLARRAAAWIAPTRFVADWHVRHGMPASRMHVVPHGIDVPAGVRRAPAPPAASTGARRFAYLGGLSHQKGVHVLIEAFNAQPHDATLTVAGDESVFPGYCAELRHLARHPGVRFVGLLDQPAVWRTLAASDVVVVPSLWYETASLIIQEAFAVGTPVVASDHGALAERVRDGVDGLHVPAGDAAALGAALGRLVAEPALLARLRQGVRPVVTIAEHAERVAGVYAAVRA